MRPPKGQVSGPKQSTGSHRDDPCPVGAVHSPPGIAPYRSGEAADPTETTVAATCDHETPASDE
jgi:hypothetical protein